MPITRTTLLPVPPAPFDEIELNRRRRDFAIFPIIRHQAVTVIGGPLGAGKTTFLMQLADTWLHEPTIWNCENYPTRVCAVSTIESSDELRGAARKAGLDDDELLILQYPDRETKSQPFDLLCRLAIEGAIDDEQTVILLDGLHNLLDGDGSINHYRKVGNLMKSVRKTLAATHTTLIATGRCAKPKELINQTRTADRFLGSTAWTEGYSSFIGIEPTNPDASDDNGRRTVTVISKNWPALKVYYGFSKKGVLLPVSDLQYDNTDGFNEREAALIALLQAQDPGTTLAWSEIQDWAEDESLCGMSRATVRRFIDVLLKIGVVEKVDHGRYRTPNTQ